MEIFLYVLGSLIVSIIVYISRYDEESTILEKMLLVFFILASWFTITAMFILIIFSIIYFILTDRDGE